MHANNLVAAMPNTLPATQIELRAIYANEEIAFQKTTVHKESRNPVWEQQFNLPVPDANDSQLEITLWDLGEAAEDEDESFPGEVVLGSAIAHLHTLRYLHASVTPNDSTPIEESLELQFT